MVDKYYSNTLVLQAFLFLTVFFPLFSSTHLVILFRGLLTVITLPHYKHSGPAIMGELLGHTISSRDSAIIPTVHRTFFLWHLLITPKINEGHTVVAQLYQHKYALVLCGNFSRSLPHPVPTKDR